MKLNARCELLLCNLVLSNNRQQQLTPQVSDICSSSKQCGSCTAAPVLLLNLYACTWDTSALENATHHWFQLIMSPDNLHTALLLLSLLHACSWDRSALDITSYDQLERDVSDNKGMITSMRLNMQLGGMSGARRP